MHETVCPSCGYCPTCGRKNTAPLYPWNTPWTQPWTAPYWMPYGGTFTIKPDPNSFVQTTGANYKVTY